MSGRVTCLVACLPLVNIYFDCVIWIAHRQLTGTGSVFPAFGIIWGAFTLLYFLPNDVELTISTASAVTSFSQTTPQARRHAGDRYALW
jgi:hypothetical protein